MRADQLIYVTVFDNVLKVQRHILNHSEPLLLEIVTYLWPTLYIHSVTHDTNEKWAAIWRTGVIKQLTVLAESRHSVP